METLNVSQGSFALSRVPRAGKRPLRAWDAADEYVLDHLGHLDDLDSETAPSVLIVGDAFGALSCGLSALSPVVICESAAGRQAILENIDRNGLAPVDVRSIVDGFAEGESFDVVVVKVPKSTSHLVDVLHRIRPHITPSTEVVGAGMVKAVRTSTIEAFESILGPTATSLAKKKARLLHTTLDVTLDPGSNPWPTTWKAHGHQLSNFGGGFSPAKLDPGTSLLIDSVPSVEELLPEVPKATGEPFQLVDLGCGNGILGLCFSERLGQLGVAHEVHAIDDSALALKAAEASWHTSTLDASSVSFHHAHRLVNVVESVSTDLVVVNPPFHDDRVVGDETAWSMFVDSHKALRIDGNLLVVGNRHLAYHAKLKKIFGNCHTVASNAKFVVLQATRMAK